MEGKFDKLKRLAHSQKRKIAEQSEALRYFKERCIKLEIADAHTRVHSLSRLVRDKSWYTGDEYMAVKLALRNEQKRNECLAIELGIIRAQLETESLNLKIVKESPLMPLTENSNDVYGLRFSPVLEMGPTPSYSPEVVKGGKSI